MAHHSIQVNSDFKGTMERPDTGPVVRPRRGRPSTVSLFPAAPESSDHHMASRPWLSEPSHA
eukprot:991489-Pelagomonas_calceolata.AAC.5